MRIDGYRVRPRRENWGVIGILIGVIAVILASGVLVTEYTSLVSWFDIGDTIPALVLNGLVALVNGMAVWLITIVVAIQLAKVARFLFVIERIESEGGPSDG